MSEIKCIVEVYTELIVDGECDSIRVEYPASYTYESDKQIIEYTETSEDGFSQEVFVLVLPEGVVIDRGCGTFVLDLRQKTGELLYDSPAGQIPLSYVTKYCRADLSETGGVLLIAYTLDIGGVTSENSLRITVRQGN